MTSNSLGSAAGVDESADFRTEFAVQCVCGQKHSGQRRRRHQQILCKECGTALFVLPIDVYPEPEAPSKKKKKGKRGRGGESAWGGQISRAAGAVSAAVGGRLRKAGERFAAAIRWLASPVRLAIYALAMIVGLTGWYVYHRGRIATAEISVVKDVELGLAALDAGEFATARDHLVVAADAIKLLGRDDEQSRRVVQSSREASALSRLATSSVLKLLRDVEAAGVDADGQWKVSEQIGYRDQWVAFDGLVESRANRLAVDLLLRVAGRRVFVRVDSSAFDEVPLDEGPQRLTFAGTIASVRRVDEPAAWNIVLEPDSIFLWESAELYPELGFAIDPVFNSMDSVRSRLEQQRLWQGGTELEGDATASDPAGEVVGDPESRPEREALP